MVQSEISKAMEIVGYKLSNGAARRKCQRNGLVVDILAILILLRVRCFIATALITRSNLLAFHS